VPIACQAPSPLIAGVQQPLFGFILVSITQKIHSPTPSALSAAELKQARNWLAAAAPHSPSWMDICQQTDDLAAIEKTAQEFIAQCAHVIVCGTGGSSLSARALRDLIAHPLGQPAHGRPQIHLLDSTEPDLLDAAMNLPAASTGWLFISRSGGTLETVTQFLAFISRNLHRRAGMVRVITLAGSNPLRDLAEHYGVPVLEHATHIGGRYSVFSNVGMLPAAILGLDIRAMRAGAASMISDEGMAMALAAAHWHRACWESGHQTHVMLPYSVRLQGWTYWYRQLWAESLGKAGKGTTPLIGLGPLDQHSMLQLLLDGPKDKSITTVHIAPSQAAPVPNRPLDAAVAPEGSLLAFLNSLDGQAIVQAQAHGTTRSFINHHLPVRQLSLPDLREQSVGALLMLQMLETVLVAQLLGVNAFDQPAVEESKTIALASLRGAKP